MGLTWINCWSNINQYAAKEDPGVVVRPNASHNMLSKEDPGVVVRPNASHNMLSREWGGGGGGLV